MKLLEDILFFCGVLLLIGTTYFISHIAGLYVMGIFLIAAGVLLSKTRIGQPPK